MKAAAGVEMLEITSIVMGKPNTIHPTFLWDDHSVILADTGYPRQLPILMKAIEQAGVPFERLSTIIITHQDIDHIGNLPAIINASSGKIEVLASETEKPYIQGEQRLLKITPEAIEQAVASLPAEVPAEWRSAFRAVLEHPLSAQVDRTPDDGELLPYCGGMTVIHTPGHTPGHISLYHHVSKTLIAGDALVVSDGLLLPTIPELTLDKDAALASFRKLDQYDIETVICYHGGLYRGNANERIAELGRSAANPDGAF